MPKVSVVVPVYNVVAYLPRCLASLRAQSLSELEVLLVDDGSTDGSTEILRDAEREDARFRVIRQENTGVAAARHAGIQQARGEYVGFVDADDYVEPEMFQRMYCAASAERADLVVCSYYEVRGQDRILHSTGAAPCVVTEAFEAYVQCVASIPSQCNKLYRRELVLQVREPLPLKIGEDMAFCTALAPSVRRAVIIPDALYNYAIHDSSTMHKTRRMDGELNPLDNFLRNIAPDSRYDTPDDAWKHLLAAQAFVSVLYTNYSYRQRVGHFYRQLKNLRGWPQSGSFCREVVTGRCLSPLRHVGSLSGSLSLALRAAFLPCLLRLDRLAAVLLTGLRRMLEAVQAVRLRRIAAAERAITDKET